MVVVDAFGRHLSGVRDNDAKNNRKYLVCFNQHSVSESVLFCLKTNPLFRILEYLFLQLIFIDRRCSVDITCYYESIAYYNC